jgi:mono/diheme cytochrome c family protein
MKVVKLASSATILALLTFAVPGLWAAEDGAALYKANCAGCHGADAAGKPAMKAPALKGKSADDATKAISSNPKHAALKKKLTDDQVKAVADYVASLK